MKSGTLFSMLAKYLPTFVVGIGIFIVFFAQYSNGLMCVGPCETEVSDVSSPPAAGPCLDPTKATDTEKRTCLANETSCYLLIVLKKDSQNSTVISKTVTRDCADPTMGTWFLPDHPFKPNTCSNVEDGDHVKTITSNLKSKSLANFQMAHVCFCDAPDSCDKREPDWDDAKLLEHFKTWTPPPPSADTTTTGDGGGGGGGGGDGDGDPTDLVSKTWKVEAIPKIIVFLAASISSSVSLSYLFSA